MTGCCSAEHGCVRTAISRVRLIPARRDRHYCRCVARALVWPGIESPATLTTCGTHRDEIKALGRVMAETILDEAIVTRIMTDEAAP